MSKLTVQDLLNSRRICTQVLDRIEELEAQPERYFYSQWNEEHLQRLELEAQLAKIAEAAKHWRSMGEEDGYTAQDCYEDCVRTVHSIMGISDD